MSYSKRSRYSPSPSPYRRYSRSISRSLLPQSRSLSRGRSRSGESTDAENPGNNLYVTGLSHRITKRDLEKHFSSEGMVEDVHLVVDPWTRESRGFGFVTMSSLEEADRCVKYLDRSVLEGRVITVEKARRRRGRTPTPGRYLGLRTIHERRGSSTYSSRRSRSYSSRRSRSYSSRRSPSYSPYRRSRSRSGSPRYSSERDRSRSYSPHYSWRRSYSPYDGYRSRRRSYSPYYRRHGSYYRSYYYSRSPSVSRRDRSYSPDDRYYRRQYYRSHSRSLSPSISPARSRRRSYSRSVSPRPRRRSSRKSCSPSVSPRRTRRSLRSCSRSESPRGRISKRSVSRDSYSSRSPSASYSSRSVSSSVTPRSASPSS